MKTTLNKIHARSATADCWEKLLAHLGKTQGDDEPLSIATILDSNGLDDALLCLRAVDGHDREIRLYAGWCARQVQYLMRNPRSIDLLDVTERFINGLVTEEELVAARVAARDAGWNEVSDGEWGEGCTGETDEAGEVSIKASMYASPSWGADWAAAAAVTASFTARDAAAVLASAAGAAAAFAAEEEKDDEEEVSLAALLGHPWSAAQHDAHSTAWNAGYAAAEAAQAARLRQVCAAVDAAERVST